MIISLIVAVVFEAIAVIWAIFTLFACCCRRSILQPLGGFSLISTVALIVALAVFYAHFKEEIDGRKFELILS